MADDGTPREDEAAERALGIRRAGVDQHPESSFVGHAKNTLPDRTRRIATLKRDRRHEEMAEGMEHVVDDARKVGTRLPRPFPIIKSFFKHAGPRDHISPLGPRPDHVGIKLEKNAFAAILDRRHPRLIDGECRTFGIDRELPLDVRPLWLTAGEARQRHHFSKPMDEHHVADCLHPGGRPQFAGHLLGVEVTFRNVGPHLLNSLGKCRELDILHLPRGAARALSLPRDGGHDLYVGEPMEPFGGRRLSPNLLQFNHRFDIGEKVGPESPDDVVDGFPDIRNRNHT